ncbi:MAG: hypothetical protein ACI4KR_05900 [Ruminiclostridium sp.]
MPLAIEILRKEVREMEKYEAPEMEIVEFETEDVITTSTYHTPGENELPGVDPFA